MLPQFIILIDCVPVKNSEESDIDYESDAKHGESESSSSDDEHKWKQEIKDQYRQIQKEKKAKARLEKFQKNNSATPTNGASKRMSTGNDANSGDPSLNGTKQPKFFEIKDGFEYFSKNKKTSNDLLKNETMKKLPLLNRLKHTQAQQEHAKQKEDEVVFRHDSFGNKEMTFLTKRAKRDKDAEKKAMEHHMERKVLRRSAGKITKSFQNKQNYSKRPK